MAARFRSVLRRPIPSPRLGGDEFVLVVPELDYDGYAEVVAEKVSIRFRFAFLSSAAAGSVRRQAPGIALSPGWRDARSLLAAADRAICREGGWNAGQLERSPGANQKRLDRGIRRVEDDAAGRVARPEQVEDTVCSERPVEEKSLADAPSEGDECLGLFFGFYPFDHDFHSQTTRHSEHGTDDGFRNCVAGNTLDETAIDLEGLAIGNLVR